MPTVDDGLFCVRPPATTRVQFDTEAGQRYLVQVGDQAQTADSKGLLGAGFNVQVATPATNGERSSALELQLGAKTPMANFGAPLDANPPYCTGSESTPFFGGRGVWGKVRVPAIGTLGIKLEPEEFELGRQKMISLYPENGSAPVSCAIGPADFHSSNTELTAAVGPGTYWVQTTPAVYFEENRYASEEERWDVTASFAPDLDVDKDGHLRPSDCNDTNPAVHPGAVEVLDDGIDQNCDGQDARRDSDRDGVPDYRDRCPARSSKGIDTDGNGCRDPEQLQLTAVIRLTLQEGQLHLATLFVRTDSGARIALSCSGEACEDEVKTMRGRRMPFGETFAGTIPNRTEVTIAATETKHVGIAKRYQLSRAGLRLIRQWCTAPGRRGRTVPCG